MGFLQDVRRALFYVINKFCVVIIASITTEVTAASDVHSFTKSINLAQLSSQGSLLGLQQINKFSAVIIASITIGVTATSDVHSFTKSINLAQLSSRVSLLELRQRSCRNPSSDTRDR